MGSSLTFTFLFHNRARFKGILQRVWTESIQDDKVVFLIINIYVYIFHIVESNLRGYPRRRAMKSFV